MTTKQRDSVKKLKSDVFDFTYDKDSEYSVDGFNIVDSINGLRVEIHITSPVASHIIDLKISNGGKIYFPYRDKDVSRYERYTSMRETVSKMFGGVLIMKIVAMYDLDEFIRITGLITLSVQVALFYLDYSDVIYVDDEYIESLHERYNRDASRCSDITKEILRDRKNTLNEILLKMDSGVIPRQFILKA